MCSLNWAFLVAQMVKNLPAMQETWVPSLGWDDPLEKGMATHSSILAWEIPQTEEPGRLPSMGSQRVGRDWSDLACLDAQECECEFSLFFSGFPDGSVSKEFACNAGDHLQCRRPFAMQETICNAGDQSLIPGPWRRKWQPTPMFLPGKVHGHRSLAGYSPLSPTSQTQLSN